jgi:hypothetical protein
MNSSLSSRLRKSIVVALVAALAASPVARAHHAPGEDPRANPPAPSSVVTVVKPAGFDWSDAGVGAGVAGLALLVVAGCAVFATRRSRTSAAGA